MVRIIMVAEESGEMDIVISKEDIIREKAKLAELKKVADEKKKIVGQYKGSKEEATEASTAAKDQAKKVKAMSRKLAEIEEKQRETDSKIKGFLDKFSRGATDPQGLMQDAIGTFLKGSRAIPIIGAIIASSIAVFKAIEKEFGPGGIFDLRLKVLDAVKSILGLLHLIDIESGEVFMAADTSTPFAVAHTNNTETKRDGHVRYNQVTFGLQ